jgi:hypothetical protein
MSESRALHLLATTKGKKRHSHRWFMETIAQQHELGKCMEDVIILLVLLVSPLPVRTSHLL